MKTRIYFTSWLLFCLFLVANGQKGAISKEISPDSTISFIRIDKDSLQIHINQSQNALKEFLKLSNNEEMKLVSTNTDSLGFTHQYFQQFFKGVRVEYGVYAVHARNNLIETLNGTYKKVNEPLEIRPSLSESQALDFALKAINGRLYKWQLPEEESWIQKNFGVSYYPKGDLVIIQDTQDVGNYKLTWKFDVYTHEPLDRYCIFIDAISGLVIQKTSRLINTNTNGSGNTRYSGPRNFVTNSITGGYELREVRDGVNIETRDLDGTFDYEDADLFWDNDNNWTYAEFHNTEKDDAALEAHWAAENVFNYYKTVHNRNSWSGTGLPLLNYVHAGNYVNAWWYGLGIMLYGDGDGEDYDPLTSLDCVAHEFGHGVCEYSARLEYVRESGAINEGFSDIWGATIERWTAPEKQTWLVGEDYAIPPDGHPGRSMSNPNTYNQPDTYGGLYWVNQTGCTPLPSNDFCGVHTNSGVLNYWYYLLSNGGSGTNDISNSYSV